MLDCTCEAGGTSTRELVTRMDRPVEHGVAVDEVSRLSELQDSDALLVVEARLNDAQVVVKRHHLVTS